MNESTKELTPYLEKIDKFRGPYHFLSNFHNAQVVIDGITYQNNESAFQAMKCLMREDQKRFTMLTPSQAKSLGRRVKLRPDWEKVKDGFMRSIVAAKFEQNPDLKAKLLATGDAILEEGNDWGDKIWGTVNGVGQNRLGKILMEVRAVLVN